MHYVDYKYIRLIGGQLEQFKELGNGVYQFRCPICGDSKKKKSKIRGYIFGDDSPRFMCHNCGASSGLAAFIKHINPSLFLEYKVERFNKKPQQQDQSSYVPEEEAKLLTPDLGKRFSSSVNEEKLFGAIQLLSPRADREIVEYAFKERMIPEVPHGRSLYGCRDIRTISEQFPAYKDRQIPRVPALVIPFFNKERALDWIQCRVLHPTFRFITMNVSGNQSAPKVWGVEQVDWTSTVYITEGPIDAMCLRNSLALGGVANNKTIEWIRKQTSSKIVFCYDNDYRSNPEVRGQLVKRIDQGFGVVIYDKKFEWKDLNKALVSGVSFDSLNNYIEERTFFGIKAKLNLSFTRERAYVEKTQSSTSSIR